MKISYFLYEQCRKEVKFFLDRVGCIFRAINGFSLKHEPSEFFREAIIAWNNTSHEVLRNEISPIVVQHKYRMLFFHTRCPTLQLWSTFWPNPTFRRSVEKSIFSTQKIFDKPKIFGQKFLKSCSKF